MEPREPTTAVRDVPRRLVYALLVPDVIAWGWTITVIVLVTTRSDVTFSSAGVAAALFAGIGAATVVIALMLARVVREPEAPVARDTALISLVGTLALWGLTFWLSTVALISR